MTAIAQAAEIKVRRASKKNPTRAGDVNTEIPTHNLLRIL